MTDADADYVTPRSNTSSYTCGSIPPSLGQSCYNLGRIFLYKLVEIPYSREKVEILIQGQMGKQPVRVKTSTQLSVKLLDVAIGMMETGWTGLDRLAAKGDYNFDLFWGEIVLIFCSQCWSSVGNELCGSGGETNPPSSRTKPTQVAKVA